MSLARQRITSEEEERHFLFARYYGILISLVQNELTDWKSVLSDIGCSKELLVKAKENFPFNINTKDSNGYTALSYATQNNKPEMVKLLIERGAYLNAGIEITTPLFIAAEKGYVEIVRHLINGYLWWTPLSRQFFKIFKMQSSLLLKYPMNIH